MISKEERALLDATRGQRAERAIIIEIRPEGEPGGSLQPGAGGDFNAQNRGGNGFFVSPSIASFIGRANDSAQPSAYEADDGDSDHDG